MSISAPIRQLGDPLLREIARPITDFADPALAELIADMQRLMLEHNGVGIAAPQLGESACLMIVASRPTPRYPHAPDMPATVMINPRFAIVDATLHKDWEGCLSVPGIRALVPRYRTIQACFQNAAGESQQQILADFPARVFQHEYDHLQGLVYLDRVASNRDIFAESEYCKLLNPESKS